MPSCHTYTKGEIALMRKGGAILRGCLQMLEGAVHPGITTEELDARAEEFIRARAAVPGFKGYQGFPATLCTSVNEECVHGIPGKRVLEEGDIIAMDCGVLLDGFYTDACITVPVGTVSSDALHLMDTTQGALDAVVAIAKAGVRVGDLSAAVQAYAEERGCALVRSLTGHGVGRNLHEFPDIPNVGTAGSGAILPAGCVIAVEPILVLGDWQIVQQQDGWTLSTRDGGISAHFEYTIAILESGCEVLA
ncbi:MAG: type I methionyl aminopeptidase [Candidatus Peribacteraceae bacterium]|nr:type I methionyl aminopeptidase [Candidatus Peribacteraceae bacterium]